MLKLEKKCKRNKNLPYFNKKIDFFLLLNFSLLSILKLITITIYLFHILCFIYYYIIIIILSYSVLFLATFQLIQYK